MKKTYSIEVDCPNCASKMEEIVKTTPGIKEASVNFLTLQMLVEFCDGADEKVTIKKAAQRVSDFDEDCVIIF